MQAKDTEGNFRPDFFRYSLGAKITPKEVLGNQVLRFIKILQGLIKLYGSELAFEKINSAMQSSA